MGQKRKWINVILLPPNLNSLCLYLTVISSVSIRITTQLGITPTGFKKLLIFCTRRQVLWNYPSILAHTETRLTDASSSVCLIFWGFFAFWNQTYAVGFYKKTFSFVLSICSSEMQSEMKDSNIKLWCGRRIKNWVGGIWSKICCFFILFIFLILPMVEKGKGCQMAGLWGKTVGYVTSFF